MIRDAGRAVRSPVAPPVRPAIRPAGRPVIRPVTRPIAEAVAAPARPALGLPFLLFCAYTFILIGRPQDYVPSLAPLRLALAFTVLTSVTTLFTREPGEGGMFQIRESRLYFLVFAVMCATIPFSIYPRASFMFVILGYTVNVAFYVLFVQHVTTVARFRAIAFVLMLSSLIFGAVGILNGQFLEGRYSTGSEMFDPNDVAFVEVSLLAFVLIVLLGRFGVLAKLLALVSLSIAVLLTLYTGSRGGFIGLTAFLALFLIVRTGGVRGGVKLAVLAVLLGGAAFNADQINVDRYLTLGNLEGDYNVSDEFGRSQIWRRGLQLLRDDPLTGVGVQGFGEAIGAMRERERLPPRWQAPHNSYVEILTETGVVGGTAFLLLVFTCVNTFRRGRKGDGHSDETDLPVMSGSLLVGFAGLLITAFFVSQAYSALFTLFFAAAAALKRIAARRAAGPEAARA